MVDDTGVSERKGERERKKRERGEDQTSQQLSDEHGTEVTTRSGLSESLPEGAPGMVEELLVWWDREGRGVGGVGGGERQHASFCYCVGEGEKDGGIILMA